MKKHYFAKKVLLACLLFFMTITTNVFAQVGIGTITPNASSVLDVSSTTQGMLTPRMTTAQRVAIVSPADGLMVYDTDLQSFYHFNSSITSWNVINSGTNGRLKFKRIKSTDVLATVLAAEKAAGANTKYLLDRNTLYEINGTITVDLPIEFNWAYVKGQDVGEDKLIKTSGDLFVGVTGGGLHDLSIEVTGGGKVFNVVGTGSISAKTQTETLMVTNSIFKNCSDLGKIENFLIAFFNIDQFATNKTGFVFKDISKLLMVNTGWYGDNTGTYTALQGTFDLVGISAGFCEVYGASVGIDVSSDPVIAGDAIIRDYIFTGSLSTGKFVKGYTIGGYTGYNFNNRWNVNSPGIPVEGDGVATGDINFDFPVGSGTSTTFSGSGVKTKVAGVTTSNNLLRFSIDGASNRLKYLGKQKRYFNAAGSLSFQSSADATTYILYIAKNGTVVNQSKVYTRSNSTNDILAIPIIGIIELVTNDYVEVWAERYSGTGNMLTVSLNLILK